MIRYSVLIRSFFASIEAVEHGLGSPGGLPGSGR